MRKQVGCILLCLFMAQVAYAAGTDRKTADDATGSLEGKGLIQPFGGLSWEDGLEAIVDRLNRIGDIEKIVLGPGIYGHSENVKGKTGSDLRELLIKSYGRFTEEGDFANPDLAKAKRFVDPKGNRIPFHECQPADITAYPVLFGGIPFEMKIETVFSPGLAALHPDRAIVVHDAKQPYAISMVLRRVSLVSSSPLLAEKLKELKTVIIGNYGKFRGGLSDDGDSVWGKVVDARGTVFSVDVGKANALISYSSGYAAE